VASQPGIIAGSAAAVGTAFVSAIAQHRFWTRAGTAAVSA